MDELIRLSERLLAPFYASAQDSDDDKTSQSISGQVQLLVGHIPGPFSEELPVPADSRIIGTLLLEHGLVAILDVPLSTGQVLNFYASRLNEAGWIPYGWDKAKDNSRRSTLDMPVPAQIILSFYREAEGPVKFVSNYREGGGRALFVSVDEQQSGISQVRLTLDTKPEPLVNVQALTVVEKLERLNNGIIPELPIPIGAQVYKRNRDMSTSYESSHAVLVCRDNIADIHAHYVGQLMPRGWTLLSSDKGDGNRWSNWVFKLSEEQTWVARLLILQRPWSTYKYDLHLVAEPSSVDPDDESPSDGGNQFLSSSGTYFRSSGKH
ncbi:MAG TPA: hypothetical protein VLQ48_15620 [Chloroflexia bacterium]|nr:hypothetical protein [Chloroflexia bacterium]